MEKRFIDNCPICSTQEEDVTEQILSVIQKKTYPKNALLFEQEDESKGLFLITKGTVKISKISPNGKEIVLGLLGAGKTFGEGSLLGQDRQADTAATTEPTEVFYLPKKELQNILQKNPLLYQSVVASLVRWMANLNNVIENINTPSAKERVWSYLCRLQSEQNKPLLQLSGKKHEVALMLGLRPETFSRALAELENEGQIKMNHKQIQILQSPK
ncbi:Crp/Fnr family transcriptional regulator [Bdellovibrio bacteriovorus]|uniref:Transcription regulator containing cAMP-binding domain n=2 Tax=Bdellovibrio bacteriovorus TaxID=959 RepID=Q6MK23_BDEBA|nr:Crp/Fnr family transcriptional regulator [Bdellovibrio bacteriovorus]AHZ85090.1 transcriptional regulator [Bdellovibrio bacteriovorus]ASD63212.1 transcriptional regulator [Bdellovibrio bacteriovorus]BEV68978.1 Cyclic AMP receptor protein [Bdellovibrio bacteriovorus]CAE80386.1 transcription regulator containing cAMP-binding domain [Bdellovibrio bacteriovorus HD100]